MAKGGEKQPERSPERKSAASDSKGGVEGEQGGWTVYILLCRNGAYYVGQTDDLDRRLAEHNDPERDKIKHTAKHGPWVLAWAEKHSSRSAAMRRERFIKSRKSAAWIRRYILGRASPDVHRD